MENLKKIAIAVSLLSAVTLTQAADIKVVASVGMKAVLDDARPLFEYATGHKLLFVLGPVPADLQSYVTFTAGISPSSDKAEAAKAFVVFLRGASVAPILRSKGME
jgi:ABC-type molybdate transport system substrate-binding protein